MILLMVVVVGNDHEWEWEWCRCRLQEKVRGGEWNLPTVILDDATASHRSVEASRRAASSSSELERFLNLPKIH
jgi:hypothetical protein